MADVADRQPDPLAVLRKRIGWIVNRTPQDEQVDQWEREAQAAIAQVEALVEAAHDMAAAYDGLRDESAPYQTRALRTALASFPRKEQA